MPDPTESDPRVEAACPFCEIIAGRAPGIMPTRWPDAVVIEPLHPVTEGHILVVSRQHVVDAAENRFVTASVMQRVSEYLGVGSYPGVEPVGDCNIITSCGVAATQTVRHFHVHVVPRREGDGLALHWTVEASAADAVDDRDEEIERLRTLLQDQYDRADAAWTETQSVRAESATLRAENERLRANLDICVDHIDLLSRSFGDASKFYTCALCGAGPDEDHGPDCELRVHRALLNTAALAPTPTEQATPESDYRLGCDDDDGRPVRPDCASVDGGCSCEPYHGNGSTEQATAICPKCGKPVVRFDTPPPGVPTCNPINEPGCWRTADAAEQATETLGTCDAECHGKPHTEGAWAMTPCINWQPVEQVTGDSDER